MLFVFDLKAVTLIQKLKHSAIFIYNNYIYQQSFRQYLTSKVVKYGKRISM